MSRTTVGLLLSLTLGWAVPGSAWADGAVYAMTNALRRNAIKVFHRAVDFPLAGVAAQIFISSSCIIRHCRDRASRTSSEIFTAAKSLMPGYRALQTLSPTAPVEI